MPDIRHHIEDHINTTGQNDTLNHSNDLYSAQAAVAQAGWGLEGIPTNIVAFFDDKSRGGTKFLAGDRVAIGRRHTRRYIYICRPIFV